MTSKMDSKHIGKSKLINWKTYKANINKLHTKECWWNSINVGKQWLFWAESIIGDQKKSLQNNKFQLIRNI